nr:FMN-binding protein [bacterium]
MQNNKQGFGGAVRLTIITLIAGLLLGAVNAVTAGPIRQQEEKWAAQAMEQVMPGADYAQQDAAGLALASSKAKVTDVYTATEGGRPVGVVVFLTAVGYGGDITLTIGLDMDKKVTGIAAGTNSETKGIGTRALEESFLKTLFGRAPGDITGADGITGATITSTAVRAAISAAGEAFDFVMGGAAS